MSMVSHGMNLRSQMEQPRTRTRANVVVSNRQRRRAGRLRKTMSNTHSPSFTVFAGRRLALALPQVCTRARGHAARRSLNSNLRPVLRSTWWLTRTSAIDNYSKQLDWFIDYLIGCDVAVSSKANSVIHTTLNRRNSLVIFLPPRYVHWERKVSFTFKCK